FRYEYDLGDSWLHQVLVEKILPAEPGQEYPRCLKGRRACPSEDVGGMWGYYHFLQALADPGHEEHDEYLEWFGGEFDPEAFDLEEIYRALRALR
ncbi:MAG: plasmid pRiA4b ORF-3 family protein, partial [Anaerolineae bacterium]|nr:plasmid pRiA4b ORF-3 family protein [Anaerolineae bacterium]